jgi:frataxin-like iron-binding protein CyaY
VEEYHEIADEYLDELLLSLEEKSETGGSGFDVEYSVRLP